MNSAPHGIRFADGEWLERYDFDGITAEPIGTRDPAKARRFDSLDAAAEHIAWAGWAPDEATVEPLPLKSFGDTLTWDSSGRPKRGRVLGVVPGGASLRDYIARLTGKAPSCVQAQDVAQNDRYVVAVPRGRFTDYHAPVVRVIDNMLRRQAEARAMAQQVRG